VLYFPNPADLKSNSSYRATFNRPTRSHGETLLLTNVLSFQVEAMDSSGNFGDAPADETTTLKAVRITIRVWDVRSQQARQTTIIQEL
jgi:hypothetical protein